MLVLKCGERSIRFRPSLNTTIEIINEAIDRIDLTLSLLCNEIEHHGIEGKGEL